MAEEVNNEHLIEQVKIRPELWNSACEDFHDRAKKKALWMEVCEMLVPGFAKKDARDKNDISMAVIKKWRNVRDSYSKSLRKSISGASTSTGRKYIYAKQLAFLDMHCPAPENLHFLDYNDHSVTVEEGYDFEGTGPRLRSSKRFAPQDGGGLRKRKCDPPLQDYSSVESEETGEEAFFESLLPLVRDFTVEQKLAMRAEFLNTISRIRSGSYQTLGDYRDPLQQTTSVHIHPTHIEVSVPRQPSQTVTFPPTFPIRPTTSYSEASGLECPEPDTKPEIDQSDMPDNE